MMTEQLKIIIQTLSDGQFHSGEELGKILGVTPSAVRKLVKQFPEGDIDVESQPKKGYRIPLGLDLFDKAKIKQYSHLEAVEIFEVLSSTNDHLNSLSALKPKRASRFLACLAEKQTAGRGRFGRKWLSPYAKNIYLSVLYQFEKDSSQLSGLSLAIAVAIAESLQEYGIQEKLQLKWPNDVFCQNKKLSGILIELNGEAQGACSAIIGVGLNVLQMPSANYMDIATIIGQVPDRNKIAGLLLKQIFSAIKLFEEKGFKLFQEKWLSYDISQGKPVKIVSSTHEIIGIGRGIDEQGCFLLEEPTGIIRKFSSGEVSLRV
ncbi:MAG: biotin--[acetyl-CoA-carboxylase] ligase [Gammaproteobacteria bacterium]